MTHKTTLSTGQSSLRYIKYNDR